MLKRFGVVLCAAALMVACGQSDAGITTAVKAKLMADSTVRASDIDVTTRNRVVTLTGKVETPVAKDQALKIARETDGVRNVVDNLTINQTAATSGATPRGGEMDKTGQKARDMAGTAGAVLSDAAITTAVKGKLLADPVVGGLKINVDTEHGVVTLSGTVSSRAEADQAVRLARETDGVSRVNSKLRVGR